MVTIWSSAGRFSGPSCLVLVFVDMAVSGLVLVLEFVFEAVVDIDDLSSCCEFALFQMNLRRGKPGALCTFSSSCDFGTAHSLRGFCSNSFDGK